MQVCCSHNSSGLPFGEQHAMLPFGACVTQKTERRINCITVAMHACWHYYLQPSVYLVKCIACTGRKVCQW